MIIYNVTVKMDTDIEQDWVKWMKQEHAPDLLKTGLFIDYRLCKLMEQDETDGKTYTVQYFLDSLEHYNTYIAEHAPKMRDKAIKKFGSRFVAFRTVMQDV
jgi:hypothetical protein